ncbi:hypothetical protein D3C77_581140 [compost metagenome]
MLAIFALHLVQQLLRLGLMLLIQWVRRIVLNSILDRIDRFLMSTQGTQAVCFMKREIVAVRLLSQ